jgi:hypothetical protein
VEVKGPFKPEYYRYWLTCLLKADCLNG